MSQTLKLHFTNADGDAKILPIANPKEGITQDEVKTAMDGIAASEAFENYKTVVKGVLHTSDSEVLYEA